MTAQIKCNKACCKRARMKINSDSSARKYIFMPALCFQKISEYIGLYVLATHIRAGQLLPVHSGVGVGVGVSVGVGVCWCNNNNRNDKAATSATIATATSERCSNNINTGNGNGQRQEWGCNMGCPATSCHVHPLPLTSVIERANVDLHRKR